MYIHASTDEQIRVENNGCMILEFICWKFLVRMQSGIILKVICVYRKNIKSLKMVTCDAAKDSQGNANTLPRKKIDPQSPKIKA